MPNEHYDVVVVGCGIGGAVAGRFAAQNGAKTLIVEKKRQIGVPEHDFVALFYSWSDAEKLINIEMDRSCIASKCEEIVYFAPSGKRGQGLPLDDAFWIHRHAFETSLTREAVRAGAELMVDTTVTDLVKENGKVKGVVIKSRGETTTIESSVVIGAGGTYGNIARMAGLPTPMPEAMCVGYEYVGVKSLHPNPRSYELYHAAPQGHLWRSGGLASPHSEDDILFGVAWGWGAGKPGNAKDIFAWFKDYLQKIGRYDFTNASPVALRAGTSSGGLFQDAHHKIATDGIMLIGDQAGKPLTCSGFGAPGMTNAMHSGRVAGEAAAKAVKAGDVSEEKLFKEYFTKVDDTSRSERPRIMEARNCEVELGKLSTEKHEQVINEIGQALAALRFYGRGGLSLSWSLPIVQDWLKKEAK